MKRQWITRGLVLLAITSMAFAASFSLSTTRQNQATASPTSEATAHYVAINATTATPNTLTVKVGETVQFNAADDATHLLGLGDGHKAPASDTDLGHEDSGVEHEHSGTFSSGKFGKGEAWRLTIKKAGTYTFHDHLHPEVNILVVAYN